MEKRSIFTRESLDHVTSPEKLDDYIRIAGTGIWILVAALLITVVAVFFWGFTGSLPKSVSVNGLVDPDNENCVISLIDASEYSGDDLEGKEAVITLPDSNRVDGTVADVSVYPLSEDELMEMLGNDWTSSRLITSDYSYVLLIQPEEDLSELANKILDVSIITDEVKPISFLFS